MPMSYYMILPSGERDRRSIGFVLSTAKEETWPWPKERWNPVQGLHYMAYNPSGKFDAVTRQELPKLTAILRPKVAELPDIIGGFSSDVTALPPLVTSRLKALIEQLAPNSCEYLPAPEIWDATFEREIERSGYQYVNLFKQVEGWDHQLSDIRKMTRADGSIWYSMAGMGTINSAAVEGHHLWRDSHTKHVLCSEEFKRKVQDARVVNLHFHELKEN